MGAVMGKTEGEKGEVNEGKRESQDGNRNEKQKEKEKILNQQEEEPKVTQSEMKKKEEEDQRTRDYKTRGGRDLEYRNEIYGNKLKEKETGREREEERARNDRKVREEEINGIVDRVLKENYNGGYRGRGGRGYYGRGYRGRGWYQRGYRGRGGYRGQGYYYYY